MPKLIQEANVRKARSVGELESMAHDIAIDLNGLEKWVVMNREFIDEKTNYRNLRQEVFDLRSRINMLI